MTAFLEPNTDYITANFHILSPVQPEVVVVDISRILIRSSANRKVADDEDEDEESYITADDVLTRCQQALGNPQNKLRFLSLSFTDMDDIVFKEVTDKLIESVRFIENNGILDLSFNSITPASTQLIIQWIKKGIQFIYLHGNPMCSMRRVGDLCDSIREATVGNMEEVKRWMSHVIFLPKYRFYAPKTQVQTYHLLHEKGYLPDNWTDIHIEFYKLYERD